MAFLFGAGRAQGIENILVLRRLGSFRFELFDIFHVISNSLHEPTSGFVQLRERQILNSSQNTVVSGNLDFSVIVKRKHAPPLVLEVSKALSGKIEPNRVLVVEMTVEMAVLRRKGIPERLHRIAHSIVRISEKDIYLSRVTSPFARVIRGFKF